MILIVTIQYNFLTYTKAKCDWLLLILIYLFSQPIGVLTLASLRLC